jgi:FdhD protein
MARGRTKTFLVRKRVDGTSKRSPDELIVEEPMEILLDGTLVATTMRTPGHDYELAVGYCHTEGLLGDAPVEEVRYCATGSAVDTAFNVVTVGTGGKAQEPPTRLTTQSSSCGLCGSPTLLADLQEQWAVLPSGIGLPFLEGDLLESVVVRVRSGQELFAATGAVHGAAAFTADGTVVVVREDIGRHNAVDKVVGRLRLDDRLPAHDLGLFVSGRASFEMVQKAWAAGFAAVVAVSAPSALAVEAARRAGLVLAGFAREGRINLYSPE